MHSVFPTWKSLRILTPHTPLALFSPFISEGCFICSTTPKKTFNLPFSFYKSVHNFIIIFLYRLSLKFLGKYMAKIYNLNIYFYDFFLVFLFFFFCSLVPINTFIISYTTCYSVRFILNVAYKNFLLF